MKLTNEGVENMWLKGGGLKGGVAERYNKLARARPYATSADSRRFLVWLWTTCEKLDPDNTAKLFEAALVEFADKAGVNVLQPAAPSEITPPARWLDLWGAELPNPWATGDLKGQTLLTQRDPMLAEWLKAFAESPYTAATSWADKQAALLKQQAISYDANTHLANPYVAANNASETDKAAFHKNASPEVIERCRWEARPISFPGSGRDFNLTTQSKIATLPRLSAIWDNMVEQEREYVTAEKASLRQQHSETEARLKALEAADPALAPPRMANRARVGAE